VDVPLLARSTRRAASRPRPPFRRGRTAPRDRLFSRSAERQLRPQWGVRLGAPPQTPLRLLASPGGCARSGARACDLRAGSGRRGALARRHGRFRRTKILTRKRVFLCWGVI